MKSIVIRQIPDDVFSWLQSQAKANVLNPEAWLRLKLIEMARKDNEMKWNSKDNEYVGTLPNGDTVHVDGDVFAEEEQKGVSEQDLNSPLVWENNQDGESVRIIKK